MSKADELQDKGIELFQQREFEAASEVFEQARDAYQDDNQPDMAAEMLTNIGLVHRALGNHEQALETMDKALQVFTEMGDRKREAQVLGNMGGVFVALGDTEQATTCYREAADTFLELGEKELYGQTLIALGDLQLRSGKILRGAATYEVGLDNIESPSRVQKLLRRLIGLRRAIAREPSPDELMAQAEADIDAAEAAEEEENGEASDKAQ